MKPAWFDHRTDIPRWIARGVGQVAAAAVREARGQMAQAGAKTY